MKVMRVEMFFIDFDEIGEDEAKSVIENTKYPNRCMYPEVKKVDVVDIGEWSNDHPLNNSKTCDEEYKRIFQSLPPVSNGVN
jgi:hypothetical protein